MSRRTNFIDGNDNFREQNLRFVRNEFEDNINQFFGAGNNNGGNGPGPSGTAAPPRDSIIVQPTPDKRNIELDQRRQYLHQLGISRNEAHLLAVDTFQVPDFNLRDIQRQRYRLSVEAGDNRQAEVDDFTVRKITNMVNLHKKRRMETARAPPPPPRNIDWNDNCDLQPNFRDIPRQRDASPENFGLYRKFDGKKRKRNERDQVQNSFRGRNPQNFEQNHFQERDNDYGLQEQFIDNNQRYMENNRNPNNDNQSFAMSNFGYNRRQASPDYNRRRGDEGSRSLNINFSNSNMNNYEDCEDGTFRRDRPEHGCFADDRNDPRSYNQHNQTYSGKGFREQQSDLGHRDSNASVQNNEEHIRRRQPANQQDKNNTYDQSNIIDLDGPSTSQAAAQQNQQQQQPRNPHRVVHKAAAGLRIAQKRFAESPISKPLTPAEIKRRKLSEKHGFVIAGHKFPYINRSGKVLPQPEDKSYAVTFFEQEPNYSTTRCANNAGNVNAEIDEEDDNSDDDDEATTTSGKRGGKKVGLRKCNAIRNRIDKKWTKLYRDNNLKCWQTWWKSYKWCEQEMNKQLESFGSLNIRQSFKPVIGRKSVAHAINVIMKAAHFSLEKNTRSHYRNAKALYMLMNETFLENVSTPIIEQLQDMIRNTPNHLWVYKMRTMVFLWAEYFKIVKAQPRDERTFAAISRRWKSPLFHWMCRQAFDEVKAISEYEWSNHKVEYQSL